MSATLDVSASTFRVHLRMRHLNTGKHQPKSGAFVGAPATTPTVMVVTAAERADAAAENVLGWRRPTTIKHQPENLEEEWLGRY